jgi:hypothetical protein
MDGGTHTLYVDDETAVTETTAIDEEIGTTENILIAKYSTSRFTGTIYKPRVFNQLLTQEEHDIYHAGTLTSWWNSPTAKYKCDEFGDDDGGGFIWDATLNLNDLNKGDNVTSTLFPTFVTDKYSFDLVDDYIDGWPTWPANFTVNAALSTPHLPYPVITQENDNTLTDQLDTSGTYFGYLHNLTIYASTLTQLQLYHAEYMHLYWLARGRATGAYHRLITEGTCKLAVFLDGTRGIFTNMAPLGDAGLATLVTRGDPAADGCTFSSATSNVTFEHNAAFQCPDEVTISLHGTFIIGGGEPAQTYVDKGGNYKFKQDGLDLDFNGSTYTATAGTYEQIAVSCKEGFEPRFIIDGEYAGDGSIAGVLTTDTTDLVIGNANELNQRSRRAIKQVYVGDKALSDRELKALYQEAKHIGATIMETGARRNARRVPAVGAVSESVDPGDHFQLISVHWNFTTVPTTSEDLSVIATNPNSDEYILLRIDPSTLADPEVRYTPGQGQGRFINGTTIDLAYTNTDGRTITTNVDYQLDESVTA